MWSAPGAVIRASWLPADIFGAMGLLRRLAVSACIELVGRAGIGTGLMRIDADIGAQAAIVDELRHSPVFDNVVILRGSDDLKARVDPWGPQGDREPVFASLKRALDPGGVLNVNRGPL
jgi:hypothetical protein